MNNDHLCQKSWITGIFFGEVVSEYHRGAYFLDTMYMSFQTL